jgi:hypothetical protein
MFFIKRRIKGNKPMKKKEEESIDMETWQNTRYRY